MGGLSWSAPKLAPYLHHCLPLPADSVNKIRIDDKWKVKIMMQKPGSEMLPFTILMHLATANLGPSPASQVAKL